MILSMTGFATSTVEISLPQRQEKMSLFISIKSLNSRFFEINCKVPSLFHHLEIPFQKNLQKQLHRGHVSLHIKILNPECINENVKPSLSIIKNYLDAMHTIQKEFNLQDTISLAQILQLPQVLTSEESLIDSTIEQEILQAVHQTALHLIDSQNKEGLQLAKDIQNQLISMHHKIKSIQEKSLLVIQEKKELLHNIMTELLQFYNPEATIKSTEELLLETKKNNLLYEIEKIDINEEIVRFNSHLENITLQIENQDCIKGKKIDFIIQELNREINTIASKCLNITISTLAIDIKSELEKAREQVQNII